MLQCGFEHMKLFKGNFNIMTFRKEYHSDTQQNDPQHTKLDHSAYLHSALSM
jgi:hypothetical protein